jgi:hypothetical protein
MSWWEVVILAAVLIGFFWLIMDVAAYARSKRED